MSRSSLRRILVWDLPTRLFHWLLAGSFTVAFVTSESERWRDVHVLAGYTVLALVAFRIVWGVIGSRHARFASFRFAPRRALAYLRDLARDRVPHYAGHNPAGAIAIYALLAAAIVVGASGIAALDDIGGRALGEFHEIAADMMLALVGLHLAGVVVGSFAHRENLAKSMVTGYKAGESRDAIGRPHAIVAFALAALVVALWTGVLPAPGLDATDVSLGVRVAPAGEQRIDRSSTEHPKPPDAHSRG